MRTLHLLRHAKSAWDDPSRPDLERPLTNGGRRAAGRLGEHLRSSGARPQVVLCSPALRTRQTLDLVATGLGLQTKVQVDESIYGATAGELWRHVQALPDEVDEAMIIGHNPGLHEFALKLSEQGDDKLRARVGEKLPTCALVTVTWDEGSWPDLRRSGAVLRDFVTPRDL